jgi:hypothetical protein
MGEDGIELRYGMRWRLGTWGSVLSFFYSILPLIPGVCLFASYDGSE